MTQYIKDDIWNVYHDYDAICCTTNSVVSKDYYGVPSLVMGGGVALAFAEKFPFLKKEWGRNILNKGLICKDIGIMVTHYQDDCPELIYFQTKTHFKYPSDIGLIGLSMSQLCVAIDMHCWKRVLLPKPGCSLGGLDWNNDVYPIISYYLDKYPQIDIIEK